MIAEVLRNAVAWFHERGNTIQFLTDNDDHYRAHP